MKNLLQQMCVTWLLCASSARADVIMMDPMEPYRADNVTANWSGGALSDIAMDITVTGKNESAQDVGYFEAEWFIDPADWAQAVNDFAALPDPGSVLSKLTAAGLLLDESEGLVLPWFEFSGFDLSDEVIDGMIEDWHEFRLDHSATWGYYVTELGWEEFGFGACSWKWYVYDPADQSLDFDTQGGQGNQIMSGDHLRFGLTASHVDNCEMTPSVDAFNIIADGEDLSVFLPEAEFSDEAPNPFPGSVTRFNQNERSAIALLTDGAQDAADSATGYYESDAYQGYPAFVLYYGFFAGIPDPPDDEGDCEGSFCDGGGGGGGGGSGDVSELVDLLSGGMVDSDPYEVPDGQSIADQVTDGIGELPCLGCEFIDQGNGWENTEVAEEAAGLADDFFGIFPSAGSCSLIVVDLIPSKDVSFSIDTCDLSVVKLILEMLCGGGTLMACIYIVIPKKTSGGAK